MHLPPAIVPASNPASAGGHLPNPNYWPKGLFQILTLVSLTILLSPFLIWFLWKRWNNLGSWKLHKGSNTGKRKHYIRTWHGWVEQDKYLNRKEMRSSFRHFMSHKLRWKTTTLDYAWVFWDPNGEKQREYLNRRNQTWIRHLPAWMRSYQHGTVHPGSIPLDLIDVEQGIPLGSSAYQTPRTQSSDSMSNQEGNRPNADPYGEIDQNPTTKIDWTGTMLMSGALLEAENEHQDSTMRHCQKLDKSLQIWRANSVETRRATSHLLFKPKQDDSPYLCSRFPNSPSINPLGFDRQDHRVISLTSTHRPDPFPMEESGNLRARNTPEADMNWVRRDTLVYPTSGSTERIFDLPNSPDNKKLLANKDREVTERARQTIIDPSGRTSSAIGNTGATIMGSTWAKGPSSSFHSDIVAYEAQGSLDETVSSCASSALGPQDRMSDLPEIHEQWYRKPSTSWADKWKRLPGQPLDSCQASQGGSAIWSKAISRATSKSCATSTSYLMPLKRRRLVDRAICVSPPSEDDFGKRNEGPAILLNDCPHSTQSPQSTKRIPSPCLGVNTTKSANLLMHPYDAVPTCVVLTQQELRFVNDLHCRLDRLHYELSPGFRAPTSEEIDKLYFGPVPLSTAGPSADVVGRATQANIRRLSVRRGNIRGSNSGPPRQSQLPGSATQKLNSWRATVNQVRQLSGDEDLLQYIPHHKVDFTEPEEGAIDVAAWILRRPPQGFPDMNLTQDTLFTGVLGKMRTQAEWNAISMTKTAWPLRRALSNLSSTRKPTKKVRPVQSLMNVRQPWEGHKRNLGAFKENLTDARA